jgi:hypothetical protein
MGRKRQNTSNKTGETPMSNQETNLEKVENQVDGDITTEENVAIEEQETEVSETQANEVMETSSADDETDAVVVADVETDADESTEVFYVEPASEGGPVVSPENVRVAAFQEAVKTFEERMASNMPRTTEQAVGHLQALVRSVKSLAVTSANPQGMAAYRELLDRIHEKTSDRTSAWHTVNLFGYMSSKAWGNAKQRIEAETILSILVTTADPEIRRAAKSKISLSQVLRSLQQPGADDVVNFYRKVYGL